MTPEGRIKNLICSWLKIHGYFFWINDSVGIYDPIRKTFRSNKSPYRIKGVSDILGIMKGGRLLAIEVKTPVGRLTPEQDKFLKLITAAGGLAFVARSLDDVEKFLNPKKERLIDHEAH